MRFFFFPFFFLIFMSWNSNAQTAENPWSISVGANTTSLLEEKIDSDFGIGGPAISLTRYLGAGFSIGSQYSLGVSPKNGLDLDYTSLDGILKFNLGKNKFIPYLFTGYGLTNFSDNDDDEGQFPSTESSRTILGGIGFDLSLSNKLKLNISSSYRSSNESGTYNHLQNIFGLRYNFGVGDKDKDGVSDKKDQCPDVPGLKEFNGCPDSDGDGISDNKDACPEEAGPESTGGCPDNDGDGIVNSEDACPDKAGSSEMNGCPDSDGDGVADNKDNCPETSGDIANNGCPWADLDGDGVPDKDDACPDIKGNIKNNGCPEISNEIIETLNKFGSNINFMAESHAVMGKKTISTLVEIKKILTKNTSGKLLIEGYSSSDGSENYNQILSVQRANSVKDYLVKLGVDIKRLEVIGYGEDNPLGDNENPMGRSMNRRVQFRSKM
jgi:outer membrane protein OmpA-like peptidoglycan-associated protein/outer membrane protein W